ncbi:helix-turn-helix transcriptional regulator [Lactococcus carnosus]|jgi:transcriptional regulator with XRE-family HTH domain|uniref:helix-turn-helix transcriptional regulator n=1 Tax=Pseudolactococcus carnosus TaxID=2749961 RepID=UPI0030B8DE5B|nr:helix-turn-helix transcriptional regulator [Lactococcus carnosus]
MDKQLEQRQKQINRLQKNLSSIRKIAGWTAEVLGNKIGVTKQTISNLENKKTPMNFTQYIAIRSVLDAEIEQNKENKVLPQVIAILLDSGDELDNDEYEEIQKSVETVSAVASGGIKGAALLSALTALSPLVIGLLSSVKITDWKKLLK